MVHRKGGGGGGGSQIAPLEIMSSLIVRLLRTAQADHPAEVKVPLDAGARPPSIMPEVRGQSQSQLSEGEHVLVCSRVDTSASRTIGDQGTTDPGRGERGSGINWPAWQLPVGHENDPSWASITQAFPPLGSHPTEIPKQDNRELSVLARSVLRRRNPIVPDSPIGMGGGPPSVVPPVSGARLSGRGMRPAGCNSRSPRNVNVISTGEVEMMDSLDNFSDGLVVKRNDRAVSLSAEAEVFSPEAVPSGGAPFEKASTKE